MSSEALSPRYQTWITSLLGAPLLSEPNSTCGDCAMVAKPNQPPPAVAFDARVKCCTFHPILANFLVGGILADGLERGTKVISDRITAGPGVTPLGLASPAVYSTIYNETTKKPGTFGRTTTMLCPFYVAEGTGLCGIYRHREAVCSTW